MRDAAKIVELIKNTSGTNDKLYLLKKNENVEGLKDILRFIYNPYLKTGISSAKINKALELIEEWEKPYDMGTDSFYSYKDVMKYLSRNNTGGDAAITYAARFIRCTMSMFPEAVDLAKAIVTQELTIGITATSLNKVYGSNFIPKIGCMLGTKIKDVPQNRIKWPCIVTEKLDGVRRIMIKEDGACHMYSRSGHEDEGLVDIMTEAEYLPDNTVYDGELLAAGTFKDCIQQRQATNSIAASKGLKKGLVYNIFDMLPLEDFYKGISDDGSLNRKIMLGATLMDESIQFLDDRWPQLIVAFGIHQDLKFIKPVPILGLVKNMDEVTPIVEKIWAAGYEGVMLNTIGGKYEIKRSKELLKVKHTEEYTLQIIDMLEGEGKFDGMLGALVVDYNGTRLGVGSGFTDEQRRVIWNHPEKIIGQTIEIDTFGESTNAAGGISLNCPIFKRFAGRTE